MWVGVFPGVNLHGFTELGVAACENFNSLRFEAGTRTRRMVCSDFLFRSCGFQDRSLFNLGEKGTSRFKEENFF